MMDWKVFWYSYILWQWLVMKVEFLIYAKFIEKCKISTRYVMKGFEVIFSKLHRIDWLIEILKAVSLLFQKLINKDTSLWNLKSRRTHSLVPMSIFLRYRCRLINFGKTNVVWNSHKTTWLKRRHMHNK